MVALRYHLQGAPVTCSPRQLPIELIRQRQFPPTACTPRGHMGRPDRFHNLRYLGFQPARYGRLFRCGPPSHPEWEVDRLEWKSRLTARGFFFYFQLFFSISIPIFLPTPLTPEPPRSVFLFLFFLHIAFIPLSTPFSNPTSPLPLPTTI